MGLIDDIKNQVKKSGTNKGKFLYFKAGNKVRVRFLNDMEDGHKVKFHDSFAAGINSPCQAEFDRDCPHCGDDDLRTRDQYAWSVWDYEAQEVKILLAPVNNASPIPGLVAMFEAYGTLTDRDYVITKNGQGPTTTYSVVPMDKAKFRNDKAKPLSESKFLQLLDKAFPVEDADDEDDEPKKKATKKKKPVDDDEDEDEGGKYDNKSAKELYSLCKVRDIDVKAKQDKEYYIDKLEAYDEDHDGEDDWDDEEGDDWDE